MRAGFKRNPKYAVGQILVISQQVNDLPVDTKVAVMDVVEATWDWRYLVKSLDVERDQFFAPEAALTLEMLWAWLEGS